MTFPCSQCGACCRHLDLSPLYAALDRGDGICRYLTGNLCSIYENRPLLCRIDEGYTAFFAGKMEKEAYYKRNLEMCAQLRAMEG